MKRLVTAATVAIFGLSSLSVAPEALAQSGAAVSGSSASVTDKEEKKSSSTKVDSKEKKVSKDKVSKYEEKDIEKAINDYRLWFNSNWRTAHNIPVPGVVHIKDTKEAAKTWHDNPQNALFTEGNINDKSNYEYYRDTHATLAISDETWEKYGKEYYTEWLKEVKDVTDGKHPLKGHVKLMEETIKNDDNIAFVEAYRIFMHQLALDSIDEYGHPSDKNAKGKGLLSKVVSKGYRDQKKSFTEAFDPERVKDLPYDISEVIRETTLKLDVWANADPDSRKELEKLNKKQKDEKFLELQEELEEMQKVTDDYFGSLVEGNGTAFTFANPSSIVDKGTYDRISPVKVSIQGTSDFEVNKKDMSEGHKKNYEKFEGSKGERDAKGYIIPSKVLAQ